MCTPSLVEQTLFIEKYSNKMFGPRVGIIRCIVLAFVLWTAAKAQDAALNLSSMQHPSIAIQSRATEMEASTTRRGYRTVGYYVNWVNPCLYDLPAKPFMFMPLT